VFCEIRKTTVHAIVDTPDELVLMLVSHLSGCVASMLSLERPTRIACSVGVGRVALLFSLGTIVDCKMAFGSSTMTNHDWNIQEVDQPSLVGDVLQRYQQTEAQIVDRLSAAPTVTGRKRAASDRRADESPAKDRKAAKFDTGQVGPQVKKLEDLDPSTWEKTDVLVLWRRRLIRATVVHVIQEDLNHVLVKNKGNDGRGWQSPKELFLDEFSRLAESWKQD
jgi:hypothetical protein